jgi:hypothetical protein
MDKKAITEAVLSEVKVNYDLETALNIWWWKDYKDIETARLTRAGNAAVGKVMKPYTFKCELENTGNGMKRLEKLRTPFYADYRNQQITIYSEQLAMMIRMYDSFERYLELIQ